MKLTVTTCHSHLLFMQMQGDEFQQAVLSFSSSAPDYAAEGLAGYVEVKLEIQIRSLEVFTKIWNSWYSYDDRTEFYNMMRKGLPKC